MISKYVEPDEVAEQVGNKKIEKWLLKVAVFCTKMPLMILCQLLTQMCFRMMIKINSCIKNIPSKKLTIIYIIKIHHQASNVIFVIVSVWSEKTSPKKASQEFSSSDCLYQN